MREADKPKCGGKRVKEAGRREGTEKPTFPPEYAHRGSVVPVPHRFTGQKKKVIKITKNTQKLNCGQSRLYWNHSHGSPSPRTRLPAQEQQGSVSGEEKKNEVPPGPEDEYLTTRYSSVTRPGA